MMETERDVITSTRASPAGMNAMTREEGSDGLCSSCRQVESA